MGPIKIKHVAIGEGVPKICVSLTSPTPEALLKEARDVIEFGPDLVEWRVDFFEQLDGELVGETLANLREALPDTPLLFTIRTEREGGQQPIEESSYKLLIEGAIQSGHVDLIDIELFCCEVVVRELTRLAKEHGVIVVMSNHDFERTPLREEILHRLEKMVKLGADLPKIAVMPKAPYDVLTLLRATVVFKEEYPTIPLISMSMGGSGVITRMSGEIFGSAVTFAAGRQASAPGQVPIHELKTVLNIIHQGL